MKITGDPRECKGSLKLLGQDLTCCLFGGKDYHGFLDILHYNYSAW